MAAVVLAGITQIPQAFAEATDPSPSTGFASVNASDVTSALEKKRVDSVRTPKLNWSKCYDVAECATVRLPVDYDEPNGATTKISLLRVKARKPKERIGSLFVNPGGPGGPGTGLALSAPDWLGNNVLDRFDIVGFDPRGIGHSEQVRCFKSVKDQARVMKGMDIPFPFTKAEETAYLALAKRFSKACSTTGKPIVGAMSTAEVARDMDVLRRAVGDKKLSYLGFSYGTALGQYYANMFPDRVRVVAVDGVIDPVSWVGTKDTAAQNLDDRLRSADGAYKALHTMLVRCRKAGPKRCEFSAGDPVAKFEAVAARLRKKPIEVPGIDGPEKITYPDFIGAVLTHLYSSNPNAPHSIVGLASTLYDAAGLGGSVPASESAASMHKLAKLIRQARASTTSGEEDPYDNFFEAYSGVICTDSLHPKDSASWPTMMAAADKRAPYFGRPWGWGTAQCARNSWTVKDEDAYTGPFNRRTSAPVLFVGNYHDPATNYAGAVSASKLLPNSRLLSSDSWGHTAYGTSACATSAIDEYLVSGTLPAAGKVCVGDNQPFTKAREEPQVIRGGKQLPPVFVPELPSLLLGTR